MFNHILHDWSIQILCYLQFWLAIYLVIKEFIYNIILEGVKSNLWKKGEIWCLIWHTEIEGCGKGCLTCISRSVSRLQWSFPAPYVFRDNRYSCIDVVIFFFRYHHGLLVSSRVIFAVTICISRLFRSLRFAYSYYETLMNHETPNYRIVKRKIIRNSGKCQNILGHKNPLVFLRIIISQIEGLEKCVE